MWLELFLFIGSHVLCARCSTCGRIPAEKRWYNNLLSFATPQLCILCGSQVLSASEKYLEICYLFFWNLSLICCKKDCESVLKSGPISCCVQAWSSRAAQLSVSWLQTLMKKEQWWRTSACRMSISMKYVLLMQKIYINHHNWIQSMPHSFIWLVNIFRGRLAPAPTDNWRLFLWVVLDKSICRINVM